MNKSLLDTDILSEIGKGIDPTVARHAASYLSAFGRYTLSAVTVAEVIWGLEKRQSVRRLQAFRASLPSMEVLPFADAADMAGRIGGAGPYRPTHRLGRYDDRRDCSGARAGTGHRQHVRLSARPAARLPADPGQLADALTQPNGLRHPSHVRQALRALRDWKTGTGTGKPGRS